MSDEDRPGSRALRRGRVSVVGQVYHVTSRAPSGAQPFAQRTVAGAMCRAFHRVGGQGRGRLLAWVLMPDHAHWLVELEPASSLSGLISTLKR
jgi:putative transposase